MRDQLGSLSGVDLEIDLLRCFVAVTETSGFTAAGELIGLSQSAVSLRIKRLEGRLGTTLLVRDPRRVELTSEGKQFLPDAIRLVRTHDGVLARHTRGSPALPCVGISETVPEEFLPLWIQAYAANGVARPMFRVLHNVETLEQVARGDLQLGLVWSTMDCPWGGEILRETEVVWAGHEALRLSAAPIPIVSHSVEAYALDSLRHNQTPHTVVFESSSMNACNRAIIAGVGIGAVPALSIPFLPGCRKISDARLPAETTMALRLVAAPGSGYPVKELAGALRESIAVLLPE